MFAAVVLICSLPQGNQGCQVIVNRMPLSSEAECIANLEEGFPIIREGLPYGAVIADYDCVQLSVAG